MMPTVQQLSVRGYKSLQNVSELRLGPLNVLIGGNGAGKSNAVGVFRLLKAVIDGGLQRHVAKAGFADALLYRGRKSTERLCIELGCGAACYALELEPTADDRLFIAQEQLWASDAVPPQSRTLLGTGQLESLLPDADCPAAETVRRALQSLGVFHFHDTSDSAPVKGAHAINDNLALRADASNLAPVLLAMRQRSPRDYAAIRDAMRMVMPSFDDFVLRPTAANPHVIQLEWRERGSDYPFFAHQLSDGTLRFACLATLLLQPEPPATVVIDEPELGLHPQAINLLTALLRRASMRSRLLVATQSAAIVDQVGPEEVLAVDRVEGASQFRRLDAARLEAWLAEYSLGELWEKGLLGGGPTR